MSYYLNPNIAGLLSVSSNGDGYSITPRWATAYPTLKTNKIAYHIYFSTKDDYTYPQDLFKSSPKFVSIDGAKFAHILDLSPGELYFFGVRAVEYTESIVSLNELVTVFDNLKVYPETLLRENIDDSTLTIPITDSEQFPSKGYLKIGVELIHYSTIDRMAHNIIADERGSRGTIPSIHNTDGYDGYVEWNPLVYFFIGTEEKNTKVFECQNRFEYPNSAFTIADGYHQKLKDNLTTDLSASDEFNETFPSYDYSSYHMTDPLSLLSGDCVGSYIGGEQFCQDGYSGVGRVIRGMSIQEQNNQRQEMLLEVTGEPFILVKHRRTGITCSCFTPASEYPDDRCPKCYGTGFVVGWEQYFNPRRSDGRILVRPGPADEDLKTTDAGLESEFTMDCWALTVPTIKDRDFVVRFDEDDNEEFRYEVISVNRNKLANRLQGGQKFKVQRVRKTDPIYQVKLFRNTSFFPSKLQTTINSSIGMPSHSHEIVISEKIVDISQINQITGVSAGHSHIIKNGQVLAGETGHIHIITL